MRRPSASASAANGGLCSIGPAHRARAALRARARDGFRAVRHPGSGRTGGPSGKAPGRTPRARSSAGWPCGPGRRTSWRSRCGRISACSGHAPRASRTQSPKTWLPSDLPPASRASRAGGCGPCTRSPTLAGSGTRGVAVPPHRASIAGVRGTCPPVLRSRSHTVADGRGHRLRPRSR